MFITSLATDPSRYPAATKESLEIGLNNIRSVLIAAGFYLRHEYNDSESWVLGDNFDARVHLVMHWDELINSNPTVISTELTKMIAYGEKPRGAKRRKISNQIKLNPIPDNSYYLE